MNRSPTPHGEERNRRVVTDHGPAADFRDARTGEQVYSGPLCSHTYSVSEAFCRNCGWVERKGIVGHIACLGCGEMW